MADQPARRNTPKDYEKLGRAVEGAIINDYIQYLSSTRQQMWSSFVRGLFAGLGGVIGATVIVALLVALLHLFGGTPVIGHFLTSAGQAIESRTQTKP